MSQLCRIEPQAQKQFYACEKEVSFMKSVTMETEEGIMSVIDNWRFLWSSLLLINYAVCSNVFFTPWANFRCNNFLEDRFVWNEGKEVQSRAAILNKSRDACWLNFSSYKIFWSLIQPNWAISLDRLCNAIRKRSCCKSYVIMETEE